MESSDIPRLRLRNQGLVEPRRFAPGEIVTWLGAVQAQDYAGAKWALGLRAPELTDTEVDEVFDSGAILRTHMMRPTWHFVVAADIRWMLMLTGPRVHKVNAHYYRSLGLDDGLLARSNDVLARVLEGGKQLTRQELRGALGQAGISTDGANSTLRLSYIVMHAELDGVICSGPRRGRQFTYALLEERAPQATRLERDEALAELTRRYFTSHGPAMVKDFTWWSGLTTADAEAGLEMVTSQIVSETVDGRTYWLSRSATAAEKVAGNAYFLPNYDEYTIGYTDHSAIFDPSFAANVELLFPHSIVVDGQVVGWWRREVSKDRLVITARLLKPLTEGQHEALAGATGPYSRFLGTPVVWNLTNG
jgi:hypothetical protein